LWQRFGTLPFAQLIAPAIRYAREGFPVMPRMAALWAEAPRRFAGFAEFARVFLPEGRAPRAGEWFQLPDLAASLEAIADTTGESFYRGELARRIVRAAAAEGGALSYDDLEAHAARWVEPIGLAFEDAVVHELPPNGQGLTTLIALGILRHLPIAAYGPDDAVSVHLQIEAMKLAFAECRTHLADPARMRIDPLELLSNERLSRLAQGISVERAAERRSMPAPDHGTVYASIADRQGRMVSFIQSNYLGFGSGVVVPNTGISLQNRGLGFSLDAQHPNCVAGGVLPFHTIMPGFLTRAGAAAMSFGVMGGHMQPQGHVQLVLRTVLHRQNPQAACDAPRWHVTERSRVALEAGFPPELHANLTERGHRLVDSPATQLFGGAQAIHTLGHGYCAASDPRKDGQAVGS
jgi:gamma-glutamyltranspeptidase/glutathione hydrolase